MVFNVKKCYLKHKVFRYFEQICFFDKKFNKFFEFYFKLLTYNYLGVKIDK